MTATLYLLRHAHVATDSCFVGQLDIGLSKQGKKQTSHLCHYFSSVPLQMVWCSPLLRCRETAAAILEAHPKCPLHVCGAFCEISLGKWEGKRKDWVQQYDAHNWQQRGNDLFNYAPPHGESMQQLSERIIPAFLRLCTIARQYKSSLLVGHRSVNQAILAYYMALPQKNMVHISQPYGAVATLDITLL